MLSSVARIFQQRKYLRMKTNLHKIGFFYQKFCLLDSAKEKFISYNNSYRNSFRFLQECFWNSFATVCSFHKFRPEIQKKELFLPSIQFCYIFSSLEKHIVVEFFENSNRNYVCMCPNLSSGHLQNDRSIFEQYIVVRKLLAALFLSNCSHFGILLFFKF